MTIMSYPCPANNWPTVLQQFSNPNTVGRPNTPAGSATSNCARMLGETANKIASGRPTAGGPTGGGTITTGLSASKCVDSPPSLNPGTQVLPDALAQREAQLLGTWCKGCLLATTTRDVQSLAANVLHTHTARTQ
jgi:hypothetical protein